MQMSTTVRQQLNRLLRASVIRRTHCTEVNECGFRCRALWWRSGGGDRPYNEVPPPGVMRPAARWRAIQFEGFAVDPAKNSVMRSAVVRNVARTIKYRQRNRCRRLIVSVDPRQMA
jgi:hypothetical protein